LKDGDGQEQIWGEFPKLKKPVIGKDGGFNCHLTGIKNRLSDHGQIKLK
jgi:hypothetical protein